MKLVVPVQFVLGTPGQELKVCSQTGWSTDLSRGGLYLTTGAEGTFAPGETLAVSITIPWDARRALPFSHIMGQCRIVRADDVPATSGHKSGLALAFCEERLTMLGAIVAP